jgi:hypothetical protein
MPSGMGPIHTLKKKHVQFQMRLPCFIGPLASSPAYATVSLKAHRKIISFTFILIPNTSHHP